MENRTWFPYPLPIGNKKVLFMGLAADMVKVLYFFIHVKKILDEVV